MNKFFPFPFFKHEFYFLKNSFKIFDWFILNILKYHVKYVILTLIVYKAIYSLETKKNYISVSENKMYKYKGILNFIFFVLLLVFNRK